jgi:glycosyltransferase involved in cell wall biosynthesis
MSEEDRVKAVQHGAREGSTYVIPNGVDVERFQPVPEPEEGASILYVGSFRHLPNILGFEKLWHEVMPRVWQRFPKARLEVVAGPDHERYWRHLRQEEFPAALDERIRVAGFVEDVRGHYARANVVAVPLLVSAGTNVKVMEAMACQRAIVTTGVGCYGLGLSDGVEVLVREGAEAFAGGICSLLEDAALRRRLGENARRAAVERFDWRAVAGEARASYAGTMALAGQMVAHSGRSA